MESDHFTFDPEKDRLNLLKHGLFLLHGVDIYLSPDKLTLTSSRKGEERLMDVADMEQQLCVLVYVLRDNDVRFISLRLASKQERGLYAKWENRFS